MKTPGPHAMTAQAGAVAAWQFRFANEGDDKLLLISHPEHGGCGVWKQSDNPRVLTGEMLYLLARDLMEAPAAVPVEALEGLVAQLAIHLDQEHHSGRRPTAHQLRTWLTTELTQLIKERSNG